MSLNVARCNLCLSGLENFLSRYNPGKEHLQSEINYYQAMSAHDATG